MAVATHSGEPLEKPDFITEMFGLNRTVWEWTFVLSFEK